MPITPPNLDDRRYDDIVREAEELAERFVLEFERRRTAAAVGPVLAPAVLAPPAVPAPATPNAPPTDQDASSSPITAASTSASAVDP